MSGALEGIRVLDLGQFTAAPLCAMVLGDLGAEVIKIERPGGNPDRQTPPLVDGVSLYYALNNRNKRSITLNLTTGDGQDIFHELVSRSDVVVESFRPGFLAGVGLGYDELSVANPGLIMVSVTGFGQSGPYRERGSLDMVAQAMGGLMTLNGEPDRPPLKVGTSPGAVTAGLSSAIGMLAALQDRHRTGLGQWVDVSLLDSVIAQTESDIAHHGLTGATLPRVGNRRLYSAPSNAFRARDGHVYIAPGIDSLWRRLSAVVGRPELGTDPRFATNEARLANVDEVESVVQAWVGERTVIEVVDALVEAKVPCGPVNDVPALFADPQVQHREMIVTVEHPILGALSLAGQPIKMSRTPTHAGGTVTEPGQDNDSVYGELLGTDAAQLTQWHAAGLV